MKAKVSPLHIIDFAITQMDFRLVPPEDLSENPARYFDQYQIDIDFGLSTDDFLKVYIMAKINYGDHKIPGYSLMAEAACLFEFDKQVNLPEDVKKSLEGFSTIYIALNSLRGLISNFTANAPFGRYILPSIDLNDLIEKKKQLLLKNKPAKKSSVAKSDSKKAKAGNK